MRTPLKTVLKNFLNHVEDLEARKKLCDDQYEREFQELKKLTDKLKEDSAYQCSFGLKDVNRPKNRYKDIVPYDFSCVILPKHEGVPGSDYINASYIKGASGAFAYIAAQGPLPNTVMDFWRMIWICDVQVLVMACNEKEAGKYKCEAYFPSPDEVKQYGNICIELVSTSQVCPDFLVRTLLVKNGREMRDVYQFHYTSWPDHGVPDTVQPILDLVRLMRDCQASETVPIVVHCSAGCGRTGTICAVDYVWACLRHGKLDEDFSLYEIALDLRRQRIAMIQTKEQYILAHKAVAAMFEQQLKVIDCHIYENLDEDGEPLIWKEVEKSKEFDVPNFLKKTDDKEETELFADVNKTPLESKKNLKFHVTPKGQGSNSNTVSHHSLVDNNLCMKTNAKYGISISSKNSESSYSCNSILSKHSNEDPIPFIDEDEVCVKPNCGRAYLDMPSCDSISKIVNCFDPFVDKVCPSTDDSSPVIDLPDSNNKIKALQSEISTKTLDKNTKIPAFKHIKGKGEKGKQAVSHSDLIDSDKKSLFLNNRDSYSSCCSIEKFQENIIDNIPEVQWMVSEDVMSPTKIVKANDVYQPSISKLKASSEKMSISTPNCPNKELSQRLFFRNNLRHVGRSDSAPLSLDCIDKSSAFERESILNMVTRKFRSSSLQTEKERESKQFHKNLNKRSATEADTGGIIALTRTMCLSLKKSLKSYSPAKMKQEIFSRSSSTANACSSIVGSYTPKSPDHPKGNSMWYDKSSVTSAIAIIKPTEKLEDPTDSTSSLFKTSSNAKSPDKSKTNETHFSYVTKPAKLKDFFNNLNRKDSATQWYNASYADVPLSSENNSSDIVSNSGNANSPMKCTGKVFPFLAQAPWKKLGQKSLSSPDSTKCFNEHSVSSNSTFYTKYFETNSTTVGLSKEKAATEVHECSVPKVIIPVDPNTLKNSIWSLSSASSSTFHSACSENFYDNSLLNKDDMCSTNNELTLKLHDIKKKDGMIKYSTNAEILKNESDKKTGAVSEVRPAIPKKMFLGRNESLQISPLKKEPETHLTSVQLVRQVMASSNNVGKSSAQIKPSSEQNMQSNATTEKNDLYININIKTRKNIEQIENTLRKTPRGAIIDLTSRESYSMEDELVNAVDQLSESSENAKISTPKLIDDNKKNEVIGAKCNSKFPLYEVIWPEHPYVLVQKSKSSSKVPLTFKNKLTDQSTEILYSQNKTGLCYSPPVRQSVTANMPLPKSQSCNNLDWSDPCDLFMNLKELSIAPTKGLVNEAVVELNTLLNQLTTKSLSENIDFVNNKKEKSTVVKEMDGNKPEASNIEPNDTIVHSVTLVTKLDNAESSLKEEEIVFHFPPPPHILPPPKNESHVESFSIVHKDGCLVINDNDPSFRAVSASEKDDSRLIHNETSEDSLNNFNEKNIVKRIPQPIHKSKKSGALRRSSSYSNIMLPGNRNKDYKNVFFEKCHTSYWLQMKTDSEESCIHNRVVPFQKSPIMSQSLNAKKSSNYVNIEKMNCDVQKPHKANMETFIEAKTLKSKETFADVNISNNQVSGDKSKLTLVETKDSDSVYGKICKISVENIQATEKLAQNISEVKKKLAISKKTERAPLPPNVKPSENVINEIVSKTNSYLMPKKLPSRKSEKAPPPPHLLQNSSLHTNKVEEKTKLPAVHEHLCKISHISQIVNKNVDFSVVPSKFANKRLSHSKSDVSVYCTLKDHRIQSINQEQKELNMKSLLLNKKTNVDSMNVNNSDSDSSYERTGPTKNDESAKSVPRYVSKDQTYQTSANSCKKEIPVAPPRSKRRSTMEVQYSNVKLKDDMNKGNSDIPGKMVFNLMARK